MLLGSIIVAFTVTGRCLRSRRFVFDGSRNLSMERRTRQVVVQCFLYGLTFLNTTIWATIGDAFRWSGKEMDSIGKHYWIDVFVMFFFPLQGSFYSFLC